MATIADIPERPARDADSSIGDRAVAWFRQLRPRVREKDNVTGLVGAYARCLYVLARGMSETEDDPLDRVASRLRVLMADCPTDFGEVFAIETELSRHLSPEVRQRRYWEYRARFERVASPEELAAYMASNPPSAPTDGADAAKPPPLRDADNVVLLNHIHRNYLVTVVREQAVRDLKRWIQKGLVRGLLLYGAILLALTGIETIELIDLQFLYFATGVVLLYQLGRLGAATSVVQRLQQAVRGPSKDSFFEATALCTGRRGISIAMMVGGIFAVLLYVVFAAGLGKDFGLSGGIFPEVEIASPADRPAGGDQASVEGQADSRQLAKRSATSPNPVQASSVTKLPKSEEDSSPAFSAKCASKAVACMPNFVSEVGKHLGFRDYPDFFKMLILAFLAGFAERLVPDAIDRLIQRRSNNGEQAGTSEPSSYERHVNLGGRAGTPLLAGLKPDPAAGK